MNANDKQTIRTLKTAIKTSAASTRTARNEARKLSGRDRHNALCDAEDSNQRERLLAYGYLRFRTYSQIEQKCRTTPSAYTIAQFAGYPKAEITAWLEAGNICRTAPELAQEVA